LIVFTILGICIGSFLNVVIYRLPNDKSVVYPASFCPNCKTPLKWYDNIPVVSYALLMGKCRYCKENISPVYPLVELLNGIMYFLIYTASSGLMQALPTALLFSALLAVFIIDIKYMVIPNELVIFILILGITSVILKRQDLIEALWGFLAGGGVLYVLAVVSQKLLKKPGMGGGDIKLMGACGLLLGIMNTFLALFLASVLTLLFLASTGRINKMNLKKVVPFGPALSLSVFVCYLFGDNIISWYFSLIGMNS
jgi:prepilin signal peptidase PulO-like enzyme (type II secretory pathway)